MPVVINDFEVLSEPQPEARKAPAGGSDAAPPDKAIDPRAVGTALRVLHVQALRTWAH
jgi:hypothetical protein